MTERRVFFRDQEEDGFNSYGLLLDTLFRQMKPLGIEGWVVYEYSEDLVSGYADLVGCFGEFFGRLVEQSNDFSNLSIFAQYKSLRKILVDKYRRDNEAYLKAKNSLSFNSLKKRVSAPSWDDIEEDSEEETSPEGEKIQEEGINAFQQALLSAQNNAVVLNDDDFDEGDEEVFPTSFDDEDDSEDDDEETLITGLSDDEDESVDDSEDDEDDEETRITDLSGDDEDDGEEFVTDFSDDVDDEEDSDTDSSDDDDEGEEFVTDFSDDVDDEDEDDDEGEEFITDFSDDADSGDDEDDEGEEFVTDFSDDVDDEDDDEGEEFVTDFSDDVDDADEDDDDEGEEFVTDFSDDVDAEDDDDEGEDFITDFSDDSNDDVVAPSVPTASAMPQSVASSIPPKRPMVLQGDYARGIPGREQQEMLLDFADRVANTFKSWFSKY